MQWRKESGEIMDGESTLGREGSEEVVEMEGTRGKEERDAVLEMEGTVGRRECARIVGIEHMRVSRGRKNGASEIEDIWRTGSNGVVVVECPRGRGENNCISSENWNLWSDTKTATERVGIAREIEQLVQ